MEGKRRLKDRLARIFWPPSLLRASAAVSGRSHSAAISSRSLSAAASSRSLSLAADIAQEPMFIPRLRGNEAEEVNLSLLRRTFSLDRRSSRNFVGCGGCRPNTAAPETQRKDRKESKVRESRSFCESGERREGDGRTCPPASPSSHSPKSAQLYYYCFKEEGPEKKKKKKKTKKMVKRKQRARSNRHELSISSSIDDEGFGFFSSEEADTFFSTRSFSSDSSEFYRRPSSRTRKSGKKTEHVSKTKKREENSIFSSRLRRPRRRAAKAEPTVSRNRDSFGTGFQPLVSLSFSEEDEMEKPRHEGFPVLKKSSDPYSDFRSSMAEMIVERQIFGTRELGRLLHSYLSLNSPENHSAILRAFADISQVLFSY